MRLFVFESRTVNISDQELIDYANKVYESLRQIINVQSLSPIWMIHRVGRITASIAKMAFGTDVTLPSKTFIDPIRQYKLPVDVPATIYGKIKEPIARKDFTSWFNDIHVNVVVEETGLHIDAAIPFLGIKPWWNCVVPRKGNLGN